MQGEGGRRSWGVPASEYSCAHHVTWSPNTLWRSTSIFNLCAVPNRHLIEPCSLLPMDRIKHAWTPSREHSTPRGPCAGTPVSSRRIVPGPGHHIIGLIIGGQQCQQASERVDNKQANGGLPYPGIDGQARAAVQQYSHHHTPRRRAQNVEPLAGGQEDTCCGGSHDHAL
jgi:hypothetical protein